MRGDGSLAALLSALRYGRAKVANDAADVRRAFLAAVTDNCAASAIELFPAHGSEELFALYRALHSDALESANASASTFDYVARTALDAGLLLACLASEGTDAATEALGDAAQLREKGEALFMLGVDLKVHFFSFLFCSFFVWQIF